jgi:hypothetical protein
VLKERGYAYNHELPICRGINKYSKLLYGSRLNPQLLCRSLALLKSLRFPKLTIIKMVQDYLSIVELADHKERAMIMTLVHLMRFTIFCLEEPYVHPRVIHRLLTYLLKEQATTLTSLCSLYHISTIISPCLDRKVEYEICKSNAKGILFDPYKQL